MLSKLKATGEGTGRLSLNGQQYVFNFDAILQENMDWLLATAIPLHGEEVLILPNLISQEDIHAQDNAFGNRMELGIKDFLRSQKYSSLEAKDFLHELRQLLRFVLHKEIKKEVVCQSKFEQTYSCELDGQRYELIITNKKMTIKRAVAGSYYLELMAENLTGPIFSKNSYFLYSQKSDQAVSKILSLELFWK